LITAAGLPPITDAARALGAKGHQAFLNAIAERLAEAEAKLDSIDAERTVQ
jgi:hypothetical protein